MKMYVGRSAGKAMFRSAVLYRATKTPKIFKAHELRYMKNRSRDDYLNSNQKTK